MSANSSVDAHAVPLGMLRRYLVANHWHIDRSTKGVLQPDNLAARVLLGDRPIGKRNFDIYVSDVDDLDDIELVIPNSTDSIEYEFQVSRVISALSAIEDKSPESIVLAIREVGYDVVRSRIPDLLVSDESIHLSIARNFVSGFRNVLAATATTEIVPSPYFSKLRKEGTKYADNCRFGHTFKGSFGFTIESPLQENAEPMLLDVPADAPFERRVMERFAKGLAAIAEAASRDTTDPIIKSSDLGFNANICEHLANLISSTSNSGLTFELAFSPEWKIDDRIVTQKNFLLDERHVNLARTAAKEMRLEIKPSNALVVGRVVKLASEGDPSDLGDMIGEREVAVLWSSEMLGDITVRISLGPVDYLRALEAHASGKPISVGGSLEHLGKRWVLRNPVDFKS